MVEQERRAVDQGPGDVLGGGEPPGGGLLDAHLQIAPQGHERRVGLDRPLGELELVAQLLQLGIDRQRRLARVERVDLRPAGPGRWRGSRSASRFFWASVRTSGAVARMARKSSGRLRPTGLAPRVTESRNRPSVQAFGELVVHLEGQHRPAGAADRLRWSRTSPSGSTPVAGETAQPLPGSLALPSIALATAKLVLAEVGQGVLRA